MAIYGVKLDVPDIPATISGAHSCSRAVPGVRGWVAELGRIIGETHNQDNEPQQNTSNPALAGRPEISLPYVTHCWRCYRPRRRAGGVLRG